LEGKSEGERKIKIEIRDKSNRLEQSITKGDLGYIYPSLKSDTGGRKYKKN